MLVVFSTQAWVCVLCSSFNWWLVFTKERYVFAVNRCANMNAFFYYLLHGGADTWLFLGISRFGFFKQKWYSLWNRQWNDWYVWNYATIMLYWWKFLKFYQIKKKCKKTTVYPSKPTVPFPKAAVFRFGLPRNGPMFVCESGKIFSYKWAISVEWRSSVYAFRTSLFLKISRKK